MVHAHWNLSSGATGHAMLSACLRAVACREAPSTNAAAVHRELLRELEELQSNALGAKIALTVLPDQSDEVRVEVLQEPYDDQLVEYYDDTTKLLTKRKREKLNQISTICKEALDELERIRQEMDSDDDAHDEDALMSVLCVTSVLWCFDRLGVESISYTPLPLHTGSDQSWRRSNLLLGMNVIHVLSADATFSSCAIALLRTWSKLSFVSPTPTMTLASLSRGRHASRNVDVTLSVGRRFAHDAAAIYAPPRDEWTLDRMLLLQTNIDDMTAEHLQFCIERLLTAGASDAWTAPIGMKKGRAAQTLHCLCRLALQDAMLRILFRHSSTLGVRLQFVDRAALHRRTITVMTEWDDAPVDVKVGYWKTSDGVEVVSIKAEFDQCRAISLATNVPIEIISNQAVRLAKDQLDAQDLS